ncbi:AMP-binding protein [Sulfolobus islandicus]|uniref:AMP-dependent synthetase and ligase n=1 Tax=Saccharolobus islandicus (strain HVE10/4) TaxID=930943 RepID=F0NNH8_SACI0|nr:acyl-CoA synthetase [Sulfolobus islandicus]ADX81936.1 AMP-dependent synthetase and ligase [Sulfolobus islandicus HVE10/4]WCM36714.1 AMP-binding protein [Sulfolobus islandicus]
MKYQELKKEFSWSEALSYFKDNLLSFPKNSSTALVRFDMSYDKISYSFYELYNKSSRLAGFMEGLGVKKGNVISVLASKKAEQPIILLATWMIGAIYQPLFTAFGPLAIEIRTRDVKPKIIFSQEDQIQKLERFNSTIITFPGKTSNSLSFDDAISSEPIKNPNRPSLDDTAILIYTSGTTGKPKGALVSFRLLLNTYVYMKYGIGLQGDDFFWNPADPGWAYGLYYGLIGPLLFGKTVFFLDKPFDPEDTLKFLEDNKITNLAFAPTAYRIIAGKIRDPKKYNLKIRRASSAGEPLNPEIIKWFNTNYGITIKDHYGQSEVGMVVYNGWGYEAETKPGSMGLPAPGYEITTIDEVIAVNSKSEGFCFKGYLADEERTKNSFKGDWYLTGDMAKIDDQGYFWFVGRQDDVVKVSGYRVGPFEIESVLITHPSVLETAVVPVDDPVRGHVFKAFVVLKQGYSPSDELAKELLDLVRQNYSKHVHLHEIKFVDSLPKTESGKIQRFKLRNM